MSVEKRKARSLFMRLVVKKVRSMFENFSFGGDMDNFNWDDLRLNMEESDQKRRKRSGTVTKRKEIAGVSVDVTAAVGSANDDVIIYLHGGAFVLGIASYQRMYAEFLAAKTCEPVIMVDYALAPEHPYPAGIDDCFKVYKAIREQRPDKRITLAGDSAGAGLCVSLTMRLKEMGEKLPDCLILHSPVIDLSGEIDRSINDDINDDFIIKKGTRESVDRLYVGDADPKNVEISPYFGDYHGFPPTFITCELHESLYADSVWLDSELEDAGVPVRTIEMDGAFHTYGTLGFLTIETARINRDIIKLIKNPEEPFGN